MESKGQKTEEWSNFWDGLTPESEIQMWDYYGLRPWILKYTPRFGKVLEAGCGLGRYNFYLSKLGIDIEGLDFEKKTIEFLNDWKIKNGFEDCNFIEGDVTDLPYDDNSLSGYISLGVVEHFIEGPQKPIAEARRVLRPGGISIITTPSISWYIFYRDYLKKGLKNLIKKLIGRKIVKPEFFQYWYRPSKLKSFVEDSGLYISRAEGADLLYSFIEAADFKIDNWTEKSLPIKIANKFENTFLSNFGAQSVTISIKLAEKMHCFLCDELNVDKSSLESFDVPICNKCSQSKIAEYYLKGREVEYHSNYKVFPPLKTPTQQKCDFCGNLYNSDKLFEDFGFNKNVCSVCLVMKKNNLKLSNENISAIFRKRKKIK